MRKIIFICLIVFLSIFFIINNDNNFVEKRGVFISYIELSKYIKDKDITTSMNNINLIINNIKELKFNLIILQIRSFSDAIYPSSIFPWSSMVSSREGSDPGYDILKYFIDKCHENNIEIYGWINPYRVRSYSDDIVSEDNPAYKWLNTRNIIIDNGIYYNPSSDLVIDLICDGVLEVISNYDVDGILFDDYFYPSKNGDYEDYLLSKSKLSYDDYKLDRINMMIRNVYNICKKYNVMFGVSPDGNIENNYSKHFSDIKRWGSENGYVDFIMPQVYYGFYNQNKPFKDVINEWENIVSNKNVSLMIALSFYKNGTIDKWALSGSDEWINNNDIIMKQIILSRNLDKYKGISLFRYDYLFDSSKFTKNTMFEIENMKNVLK